MGSGRKAGFYEGAYIDSLFQQGGRSIHGDLMVAANFVEMSRMIFTGKILHGFLGPISDCSFPDRDISGNNSILADLPSGFSAEFTGMSSSRERNDGYLAWELPICLNRSFPDGHYEKVWVRSGNIPLEVGTTEPWTTLWHFKTDRGVARWPYDSKWIWLYVSEKLILSGHIARALQLALF